MKNTRTCAHALRLATLAATVALPGTTHAVPPPNATITWGLAAGIAGESDVLTAGTLVGAFNLGTTSVSATTVNAVPFAPFAVPSFVGPATMTVGNFSLSYGDGVFASNSIFSAPAPPYATLTPAYKTLLAAGVADQFHRTFTLSMNGLTPGQAYAFQWWCNDGSLIFGGSTYITTAEAVNTVSLLDNTSTTPGTVGQQVTGTFTANAIGSETVTFSGNVPIFQTSSDAVLNAFQLRTVPAPEPASGALLAGGLALLLGTRTRHRAA